MDDRYLEEAVRIRKILHQIPERSMQEVKTLQTVTEYLKSMKNLQIRSGKGYVYAVKHAENAVYRPVAIRADFDAVCLPGDKMGHYCGHDGHTAVLCALAGLIDQEEHLDRDVYLIFQPGEETGEGAKVTSEIVRENHVSEIYGFHNIPGYPLGCVLTTDGTFACASTGLSIHLKGSPSHAAYPENGKNPSSALCRILLETEELTKRKQDDGKNLRMTVIGMESGSHSYGVSASEGELRLTLRGEKENEFAEYLKEINEIIERTVSGQFETEIQEIERFPATENDAVCADKVRKAAGQKGIPYQNLKEPMRWSEDFGWYLQKIKGAFYGIGAGTEHAQLHTEQYEFPDEIIGTAMELFYTVITGEGEKDSCR